MTKIISLFITFLNRINKIIWKIITFLSKFINVDDINLSNKPNLERYRQFKVDIPALKEPFIKLEQKDYKKLIRDKNIKPIKRLNNKDINTNIKCPCCNAPKDYIYDNNGKQTQFKCKVCSHVFSLNIKKNKDVIFRCPHCRYALDLRVQRKDFDVYVCRNNNCSYYINNKAALTFSDKQKFLKNPTLFKLHYVYRKFNIDFPTLSKDYREFIKSPVDLSRIYSSQYIVGLCLTYHVNYGLSYRKTSSILKDVHEVYLSYKTVENYCKAASSIVHPILEFYPYNLSNNFAADETYIKVKGKTNYIFFFFDTINKIITSYRVFDKRDSLSSIKATYSTLSKFNEYPNELKIITDGNPIYNVANQYFNQHEMPFNLYQVIGLTNLDDTSKQYRSEKQIIERHNRTLKYYYRPKNGFASLDNANNYMVLFATCFNFLRPHSSLDYKTLVELEELKNITNMPNKWIEIINLGYKYSDIYS